MNPDERIAKLESDVGHLSGDITLLREEISGLRYGITDLNKTLRNGLVVFVIGLLGMLGGMVAWLANHIHWRF